MRKNISSLLLVVALFAFSPMVSNAQEKESAKTETEKKGKKKSKVGSFLKKVGEQATGINMTDEPFTVFPAIVNRCLEVEIIGCYGDKASESATLVFNVKAKRVKADFRVGDSYGSDKAYDKKGNSYERNTFSQVSKDCPKGVPVKYEVIFKSIPTDLDAFELISLGWWLSAGSDKGHANNDTPNLEFRNIPIVWE